MFHESGWMNEITFLKETHMFRGETLGSLWTEWRIAWCLRPTECPSVPSGAGLAEAQTEAGGKVYSVTNKNKPEDAWGVRTRCSFAALLPCEG